MYVCMYMKKLYLTFKVQTNNSRRNKYKNVKNVKHLLTEYYTSLQRNIPTVITVAHFFAYSNCFLVRSH